VLERIAFHIVLKVQATFSSKSSREQYRTAMKTPMLRISIDMSVQLSHSSFYWLTVLIDQDTQLGQSFEVSSVGLMLILDGAQGVFE